MQTNLASILHQADLISLVQEQNVVDTVHAEGINVPSALTRLGIFSDSELARHVEHIFAIALIDIHQYDYAECCKKVYQRELVLRHRAIPLQFNDTSLFLGISDPTNLDAQDEFRFATGKNVELLLLDNKQLESAIRRIYGSDVGETEHARDISNQDLDNLVDISEGEIDDTTDLSRDSAPVTRYINQILLEAVRKKASDIHFEPYEESYRIRFRCDGILHQHATPPTTLSRRLSTRLKVMSKLNIAERRKPQDGRIKLKLTPTLAIDLAKRPEPNFYKNGYTGEILNKSDFEDYRLSIYTKYLDSVSKPKISFNFYKIEKSSDSIIQNFKYDIRIGDAYIIRSKTYEKIGMQIQQEIFTTIDGEKISVGGCAE